MSAEPAAPRGPEPAAGPDPAPGAEPVPQKRPAFEPAVVLLDQAAAPPSAPRPASTLAGAGLVLLRVAAGVAWLASAVILWLDGQAPDIVLNGVQMSAEVRTLGITALIAIGGGFLALEAVLAVLVLRGRNGPRVALLLLSTLSVVATFAGWWEEGQQVTIKTTLVTLSLDILILLALSSRASAAWARRPRARHHRSSDRLPAD